MGASFTCPGRYRPPAILAFACRAAAVTFGAWLGFMIMILMRHSLAADSALLTAMVRFLRSTSAALPLL
jgi:hypothetical protein